MNSDGLADAGGESVNFYDDAEFAVIKMVRMALRENENTPLSAEMAAVVYDMYRRHGPPGVTGLAIALARQYSSATVVIAHKRGIPVAELIDDFEQHKLQQTTEDGDDE
jgi:hypothetical protein